MEENYISFEDFNNELKKYVSEEKKYKHKYNIIFKLYCKCKKREEVIACWESLDDNVFLDCLNEYVPEMLNHYDLVIDLMKSNYSFDDISENRLTPTLIYNTRIQLLYWVKELYNEYIK